MGVATIEAVAREWNELSEADKVSEASRYLEEIESDGLAPLREALALLQNSSLRREYGFDLHYDIARAYSVKLSATRTARPDQSAAVLDEIARNLASAREHATARQADAALKDLDGEITFVSLREADLIRLRGIVRSPP